MPTYGPDNITARPVPIDVPYAASVVLDMSIAVYPEFRIGTLTGPISISFANAFDGQQARVRTKQDGTGSRLITWDSAVCVGSDDLALPAASTGANKGDLFGVATDLTFAKPYQVTAATRGRS